MINHDEVLVITESKKLIKLNIETKNYIDVCKLPRVLTGDELKDRNTFYSTEIITFRKSKSFYIKEVIEDDNKIRITYFSEEREGGQIK